MTTGALILLLLFCSKMAWSCLIFPEELKDVKSGWEQWCGGQNIHSNFPIRCYRKTRTNFWQPDTFVQCGISFVKLPLGQYHLNWDFKHGKQQGEQERGRQRSNRELCTFQGTERRPTCLDPGSQNQRILESPGKRSSLAIPRLYPDQVNRSPQEWG